MYFIWEWHREHPSLAGLIFGANYAPMRFNTKEEAEEYIKQTLFVNGGVWCHKVMKLIDA